MPYTASELRDECVADTKKQVKENNDRGVQLREIIGELGWKNAMKKHLKDFQVYICILAKNNVPFESLNTPLGISCFDTEEMISEFPSLLEAYTHGIDLVIIRLSNLYNKKCLTLATEDDEQEKQLAKKLDLWNRKIGVLKTEKAKLVTKYAKARDTKYSVASVDGSQEL